MKLTYIIDSLVASGGAEQAVAHMTPFLVKAGIEVDIIVLSPKPGLEGVVRQGGATVTCISGTRTSAVRALVPLLRRTRPDLVHTTLFEADLAGRTAAAWVGIPVVTSLVNVVYGPEHRGDPLLSPHKVRAAQVLDAVTALPVRRFHALTHHVAEVMRPRLHIRRTPLDVIPRGRDPERLGGRDAVRRTRVREQLGVAPDTAMLLVAARHEHQKGLDVAVAALRELPETTLLVSAGREGSATRTVKDLAAEMGVAERVLWLGTRSDVPDLMAAADVVVVPSRWEGLGSVVIEAMGVGTPLVVSDVPAVRETLGGEQFGLLVAPGRSDVLAEAILRTIRDPTAWQQRSAAARGRFRETYTLEAVTNQMLAFYGRALSSPRPSGVFRVRER